MADTSVIFRLLAVDDTAAGIAETKAGFEGLNSTLAGIGEAFAGMELFNFASESISAADQASRVFAQTQAILQGSVGVTAQQIQDLANKYGELDGVEGSSVQNALNFVLREANVKSALESGAISGDALTQTLLNLSATMAQGGSTSDSLGSASKALASALANPFNATKALKAAGDTLTFSQTQQLAGFKKAGDQADAYKLVLGSLEGATKGAAAANTTPLQQLSAQFDDLKVKVGTALMPAFTQVAQALLAMSPDIIKITNDIAGFINFLVAHKNLFGPILASLGLFIGGLKLVNTAIGLTNGVLKIFGSEMALTMGPWGLAIMAIVAVLVVLYLKFDWVRNFVNNIVSGWVNIFNGFKGLMVDLGSAIKTSFGGAWQYVVDAYNNSGIPALIGKVEDFLSFLGSSDASQGMSDLMGGIGTGLESGGQAVIDKATSLGGGLAGGLSSGVSSGTPKATAAVETLAQKVAAALTKFKSTIVQSFGSLGSVINAAANAPVGSNGLLGNLQASLVKAKQFVTDIATLRKAGLNTTSLNELIAAGPDQGADAARQLATTGLSSVGKINLIETSLNKLGNQFATTTANAEFGSNANIKKNQVYLNFDMSGVAMDDFVKGLRKAIRVKGGNVQTVLGGSL